MKQHLWIHFFLIFFLFSCGTQTPDSSFTFERTDQGVRLSENGQPVFFYQEKPKSLDDKYICNNYLHPLFSLNGDTLTEEFPTDHPYHRGIFWAWHQIYVNGKSIGDGWIMENIQQDVIDVSTASENALAELKLSIQWRSPLFENSRPFIGEATTITVHGLENDIRKIDFSISLKALVPGVELGGADNEKGYGGLCARLKLPDDLTFTSASGPVIPQTLQINAGAWMDFSGSFNGTETCGVSIFCHPETPNYPAPWIIRPETSMQNIVFPGRDRIEILMNEPVVLYYRLIIHEGKSSDSNRNKLQAEYSKMDVSK
jgi:hypothetical protein